MPKAGKGKSSKAHFLTEHASMYGLRIMERCPSTSKVVSVQCQFCVYYGPETDPLKPVSEPRRQRKWHGQPFEPIGFKIITSQNILPSGSRTRLLLTTRNFDSLTARFPSKTPWFRMSTSGQLLPLSKSISIHLSSIFLSAICFSTPTTKEESHS